MATRERPGVTWTTRWVKTTQIPHAVFMAGALDIPYRRGTAEAASVLPNAAMAIHHKGQSFPGEQSTCDWQRPFQITGCIARIPRVRQENMTVELSLQASFYFYYLLSQAECLLVV